MGLFVSRTWFIYARDENDRWLEPLASTLARENDLVHHMGRFKHFVFSLGLGKLDSTISKIYLYQHRRMAKCVKENNEIKVEFTSIEVANAWTTCKRSKQGRRFDGMYTLKDTTEYSVVFSSCPGSQAAEC